MRIGWIKDVWQKDYSAKYLNANNHRSLETEQMKIFRKIR
jgi:hypothetical protein